MLLSRLSLSLTPLVISGNASAAGTTGCRAGSCVNRSQQVCPGRAAPDTQTHTASLRTAGLLHNTPQHQLEKTLVIKISGQSSCAQVRPAEQLSVPCLPVSMYFQNVVLFLSSSIFPLLFSVPVSLSLILLASDPFLFFSRCHFLSHSSLSSPEWSGLICSLPLWLNSNTWSSCIWDRRTNTYAH